ncbi:glycosyltransferase family 2 protein [Arthrobacter bambusae]|uniref:glycosyltransferase family 2 protein n=1 Tax=Arthrobacter bambusae TaxID=1338426 RepID=UPI002780664A|nr:glycosyltransferase family 2 protein [Arthrobacter bambusae]MDQ0028511.1 glycosyltransferase involved in cell wall biosynthesis [Arthrobacter bambusae]MDQ0096695.1 glycosyltransferase involved in cell wall biosynthesis [Arthrobacter bambusae]
MEKKQSGSHDDSSAATRPPGTPGHDFEGACAFNSDGTALVDVVFPCLNERSALPHVLRTLPAGYRAIVVDNGSSDGSGALAASLGAAVVEEPRRGFGAAAHAGLLAATAEYVGFCDCDGSLDPAELAPMLELVRAGRADLVLGARHPVRGSWPVHARLANIVLSRRLRRLTGIPITDLGPLRLARRSALLGLDLTDRRSGYPLEMFLKAHRNGWRVAEVPVTYAPRLGKSKVTGTVRGTLMAMKDMSAQLNAASRWLAPPETGGPATLRPPSLKPPSEGGEAAP